MKGIVLAGGSGTRLAPMTLATSKQLLPVYDKPMIYYPISTLMLAGIRDILIITTPHEQSQFIRLLGDGSQWGVKFSYEVQESPEGIAQALVIGEGFVGDDSVTLILGDNIFVDSINTIPSIIKEMSGGAHIFIASVSNPNDYGVVVLDQGGTVIQIEEKPVVEISNWAITGLYVFDQNAAEFAKSLGKSPRDEFEIVDVIRKYHARKHLSANKLPRDSVWFDLGTPDRLFRAAKALAETSDPDSVISGIPELIAFRSGWISDRQLNYAVSRFSGSNYSRTLKAYVDSNS